MNDVPPLTGSVSSNGSEVRSSIELMQDVNGVSSGGSSALTGS